MLYGVVAQFEISRLRAGDFSLDRASFAHFTENELNMNNSQAPESLDAARTLNAIVEAGITHVVTVPDTFQRTLLDAIEHHTELALIQCCTEDEAICINAGLFMTGWRALLSIQNNGLYACLNALKGVALECDIPTVMLIGQYGQVAGVPSEESHLRQVRMLEPTLRTWEVPFSRLYRNEDLRDFASRYDEAMRHGQTVAFIIGAVMA